MIVVLMNKYREVDPGMQIKFDKVPIDELSTRVCICTRIVPVTPPQELSPFTVQTSFWFCGLDCISRALDYYHTHAYNVALLG